MFLSFESAVDRDAAFELLVSHTDKSAQVVMHDMLMITNILMIPSMLVITDMLIMTNMSAATAGIPHRQVCHRFASNSHPWPPCAGLIRHAPEPGSNLARVHGGSNLARVHGGSNLARVHGGQVRSVMLRPAVS